eukprot:TRINITY_DN3191_c0_g1_i1.p2 TRINITY_DN3191_c0_g1~~TRINITY_DN3191_c0_g1_i1.p2  ORF type:complete len:209 (-),score=10.53 TRINITY_DN3191_c0_g1_i1:895-1521(-)
MAKELLGSDLIESLTNMEDGQITPTQSISTLPMVQSSYTPTQMQVPTMRPIPGSVYASNYRSNIQTPVNLTAQMPINLNGVPGRGQHIRPPQYPTPQSNMSVQVGMDTRQPISYQNPHVSIQSSPYYIQQMQYRQQQQQQQQMVYAKQQHLLSMNSGWQCGFCAYFNCGKELDCSVCGACGYERCNSQNQVPQLQHSPQLHPLQRIPG